MEEIRQKLLDNLIPELDVMILIFRNEDGQITYTSPNARLWLSISFSQQKLDYLSEIFGPSFEAKRTAGDFANHHELVFPYTSERSFHFVSIKIIPAEYPQESYLIIRKEPESNTQQGFDDFINFFPEAYFETDERGRITYLNKAGCEKLELCNIYKKQNIHIFDIISPEEKDRIAVNFQRNLAGERYLGSEYKFLTYSKKELFVEVFSKGKYDKDGNATGVTGIAIDITNRKKIEQRLAESELKYRTIFDNSPLGIYRSTPDGKLLEANESFATIFGYRTAQEMIDSSENIRAQYYLFPEIRDQLIEDLKKSDDTVRKETIFKRADGTVFDGIIHIKPVKNKLGKVLFFDGLMEDITQRKLTEEKIINSEKLLKKQNKELKKINKKFRQINEKLLKAKQKAEESDHLKSAFLANMSHEIRTPLNGIIGFSSLLLEDGFEKNKREQYAQIICNSSNQLLNIVNDILDISKIETNQISVYKTAIDPYVLLNELFEFYKPEAGKRNLYFRLECDKLQPIPKVFTDDMRLKQIITNFISNSLKFTKHGGITIGYSLQNNKIIFFVSDTGVGIQESEKQFIFERFRQAGDIYHKSNNGTGLGLAISKGLAGLLGGEIQMESELGKGSTFYFILPLES